jgi:NAD(P)-dependent dehydrogenase (short-subunit alcohol dehydrogenase family)
MPVTQQNDPREGYQKPTFEEKRMGAPGTEGEMRNKPDHGEDSYHGFGRMEGKSTLITGGDSGIGKAVAIAYAREGANVAVSYLPEEEDDAQDTLRWIEQAGARGLLLPGSIVDEQHCIDMVNRTHQEFGSLDVLVNNAAFQMTHDSIEELSSEEWDHTFRTNIYAMFYLSKAALPRMSKGGAIVNTASVQAYQPTGKLLAYATTKGAIVTFSKALSELAIERGVRVNVVAPGPVWTPLIPSTMPEEKVKHFGEQNQMKRPAQPAELAAAYVFLATQDSRFMTGSVLDLTGGEMLP